MKTIVKLAERMPRLATNRVSKMIRRAAPMRLPFTSNPNKKLEQAI